MLRGGTIGLRSRWTHVGRLGTTKCPITSVLIATKQPILSAGRPVRQSGKATLNGHDVWAAKHSSVKGAEDTFDEYGWTDIGGRWRSSPNKGYFQAGEAPGLTKDTDEQDGQKGFHYKGKS